ncbi:uncharacterized protein (TIGR03086 family) [Pseudonocardia endophytica]|uniref:Uncharacterized protein (TIGR03086 family) n=1 Tax=Pseudonocardia endophytica TaxID=401976 RepID=A0A4R1HUD3_PSEEN|nr:uncharacterized protein (TIGR03086 family) [Pseudonocardia endophytica]
MRASIDALASWRPSENDPPTPCAGWRLTDLVAHMTVQQRGFARALAGERTMLADWEPVVHDDPLGAYRESCAVVLDVLDTRVDPDAPVLLPEIRDEPIPAGMVVGFHLVDNVVHAWDAARSLGDEPKVDDDAVVAALEVARAVPDGDARGQEGSSFGHGLPVPDGADPWTEMLSRLGRDPGWTPAGT